MMNKIEDCRCDLEKFRALQQRVLSSERWWLLSLLAPMAASKILAGNQCIDPSLPSHLDIHVPYLASHTRTRIWVIMSSGMAYAYSCLEAAINCYI